MADGDVSWHSIETAESLSKLSTSVRGLSAAEAGERLAVSGRNRLEEKPGRSPFSILIGQFRDPLVLVLILSSLVAISLREVVDGGLILAIVVLNGLFGFIQDYKAERNIEELRKLSRPKSIVIRDGAEVEVDSEEVVPGDILVLEEGDSVSADARVVEAVNLMADESSLTGESVPVEKNPSPVDAKASLPERSSMVYKGTTVVGGRGRVVVTATGMRTQLGGIARNLQAIGDEKTPFQRQMDSLGRKVGLAIVAISIFVGAVIFLTTDTPPIRVLLIAIALGVAAIPEGLPAVITLSLALGSKRMFRKKALLRNLPVAEGLGSVDIICTDKTGTLTENRMTVRKLYFDGRVYEVSGTGHDTLGEFSRDGAAVDARELKGLLLAGILNNNSRDAQGAFSGDPTEIALRVAAMKGKVAAEHRRVDELAFSSLRKMMTTVHETPSGYVSYTKGAPETVLARCDRILEGGSERPMTADDRRRILEANSAFASEALRVIAFARKDGRDKDETGLAFIGLEAMMDPPRTEVPGALADCKAAGIRVIMITGDSKPTAVAVAREIGLPTEALEGRDIDGMSEVELQNAVKTTSIFARVSPENKLSVLMALRAQGHIVAMTGDGVNDAPALKAADVGVSMGVRGTEVAKQTSDIILLDDNFATIRDAILEGRRIFDNVRKFVRYLFPCNLAEVAIVFIAALPYAFGQPMVILTAVQLLWINVITDGLPALALGVDPPSPDIMRRKPRGRGEGVINRQVTYSILFNGFTMTAIVLSLFWLADPISNFQKAQTIALTSIVFFKLVRVQGIRSAENLGMLSNKWLLAALGSSLLMHVVILYTPLSTYFKVVPLAAPDWALVVAGMIAFAALSSALRKALKAVQRT